MDCYDEVSFYIVTLDSSIVFFADDQSGNRMVNNEEEDKPTDGIVQQLFYLYLLSLKYGEQSQQSIGYSI